MENETERRRALLKAGAAIPLIATIPCGAALANNSIHQCIVSAVDDTEMKGDSITVIRGSKDSAPTPDEYLRVAVDVGVLREKGNKEFRVAPCYKLGEAFYDESGNKYTGFDLKFRRYKGTKGSALVLIVFRPDDDYSDAELVGVWPEKQLDVNETALNGSCYTSISPGAQLNVMT